VEVDFQSIKIFLGRKCGGKSAQKHAEKIQDWPGLFEQQSPASRLQRAAMVATQNIGESNSAVMEG
jgi:hypothetical protein